MGQLDDLWKEIEGRCYSLFEGCACRQDIDHKRLHNCAACNITWTTEQSEAWIDELLSQPREEFDIDEL
jgi:hypothetical protein